MDFFEVCLVVGFDNIVSDVNHAELSDDGPSKSDSRLELHVF